MGAGVEARDRIVAALTGTVRGEYGGDARFRLAAVERAFHRETRPRPDARTRHHSPIPGSPARAEEQTRMHFESSAHGSLLVSESVNPCKLGFALRALCNTISQPDNDPRGRRFVSERLADLRQFYDLLDRLEDRIGGRRQLARCNGRMGWPGRGVYFFFEDGETRSDSGSGPRVVRVGTHALKYGSRASLWGRLAQHRGVVKHGGGNHRGSVFRKLVGSAVTARQPSLAVESWDQGQTAPSAVRAREHDLECRVSEAIGRMPFLWIEVPDEPAPDSLRGVVERNAIALLSNHVRPALDPPSDAWLGNWCPRNKVQGSGLWNNNHVNERHAPAFLDAFQRLITNMDRMGGRSRRRAMDGTPKQ